MEEYTVKRTSSHTSEVTKDFVIDESSITRKVFRALIVDNPKDPEANLSGYIIHQRKSTKNEWEDVSEIKLNELKAGEGVKLKLSCSQLKRLKEILKEAYALANYGLLPGEKKLVVSEADKIIEVPAERKIFIQQLLEKNLGEDLWKEIVASKPDLATKLAWSKIQDIREKALEEFEQSLKNSKDEAYWQQFFVNNDWIFGYGLKYQFLHLLTDQPNYGGKNITGKGGQKGDFLCNTSADIKFTVLVEIKTPGQPLLAVNKNGETITYRNGVPIIHGSLVGAISQIQVNASTWENEGSKNPQNSELLNVEKIFTHSPKGILIAGHSKQLNNFEKRKAFELFRRNITNPEILLYDELFERAKFIVGNITKESPQKLVVNEENDLPF